MRGAFAAALTELAERDPRILLLTGDLGYMALEPFAERFPDRFFNVGVAEQNLVGLATGLSEAGFIPYVYSIVTFATLRPYEAIRNGPVQHRLPVRIVGVGGGVEYGQNGLSHFGLEDIGVMRLQPALTVIAPADHEQARAAVLATWDLPGPVYLRLGKDDKSTVPGLAGRFELGHVQRIGDGGDLLFIAMGNAAHEAALAVRRLETEGVNCTLLIVASLNPAPVADLATVMARFPVALTVEAHYTVGGLGSLVAETIAEQALSCRLVRCGFQTMPDGVTGSMSYLHAQNGIAADSLVATALAQLRKDGPLMAPGIRKKLSAIIACYRDAPAVPIMHERLTAVFQRLGVDYEIIFVNDGSPDNAREVLTELAARDGHVVVINHTRAFGSQNAFTSGMRIATGDAVVLLDGDLQDPPELIEPFHAQWQAGFDVVYGVRVKREATTFLRVAYKAFYRVFRKLSYVPIPLDAGDFSLIDRRVVDALNSLPENNRFLRGLRAWVGFKQTGVPYVRPERMFGRTTNSMLKNLGWARKAIFSFSYVPLDIITWLALVIVSLSTFAIIAQITIRIFWPGSTPSGFTTLIVLILFLGGIQLLCLSIIGSYLSHIYDEVKRRPPFVVESILNEPGRARVETETVDTHTESLTNGVPQYQHEGEKPVA